MMTGFFGTRVKQYASAGMAVGIKNNTILETLYLLLHEFALFKEVKSLNKVVVLKT